MLRASFSAVILGAFLALAPGCTKGPSAICELTPIGKSGVSGRAVFTQHSGYTRVEIQLQGLTPGKHGIHVHEGLNCGNGGKNAGGHFNPLSHPHGGGQHADNHLGDLGNIEAGEDGKATLNMDALYLSLKGPDSILDHAVVVHADPDDLKSQPAGNSGARLACGLIVAVKP